MVRRHTSAGAMGNRRPGKAIGYVVQPAKPPKPSTTMRRGNRATVCPVCKHEVGVAKSFYSDVAQGIHIYDLLISKHAPDGGSARRGNAITCAGSQTKATGHVYVYGEEDP